MFLPRSLNPSQYYGYFAGVSGQQRCQVAHLSSGEQAPGVAGDAFNMFRNTLFFFFSLISALW